MITQANTNKVGLVVKGVQGGVQRGWKYNGGNVFQADRTGETITAAALQALAAPGSELTYTVVTKGSETRIGIDRDLDGFFDRTEIEACSNPANAMSVPGSIGVDIDEDFDEDADDLAAFGAALVGLPMSPTHVIRSDMNCDGSVNGLDIQPFVASYLAP